ncbi:uncharacterized protein TNCV_2145351 [Trichonephila clavipes]|uniref:Uncharacterized protein n=1 Tax=Trichonephila clavipes TaxID=2585209 RepID=A0A8X6T2B6_TRICX|nr:uncharacterized protein TNCV_2145351 [Trichonephila clavipes]
MSKSSSQMIPDMLDWIQFWGSGRPRKDGRSTEGDSLVTSLPCEAEHWLLEAIALVQWYPIPSHQLGERCIALKQRQDSGVYHEVQHTNTIVISAEIESGFVAKDDLVSFRGSPVSSWVPIPNGGIDRWVSSTANVMYAVNPNSLQPGAILRFEKTQGTLLKVLPVPEWWPTKQVAIRMHFSRCGDLLDDWSVEDVLSLVFV